MIDRSELNGLPHHGLGRGFKVAKEEIAGAIAALKDFSEHEATYQGRGAAQCHRVADALRGVQGLTTRFLDTSVTGRVPLLVIEFEDVGMARATADRLRGGDPAVQWL